MRKLFAVFLIISVACAPVIVTPTVTPTATPKMLVLPKTTQTPMPTATPVVVTPTPTKVPKIQIETYVVQPGDTLTDIAQKFDLTVEYLAGINSIADPDQIYAGQVLKLTGQIEIPCNPDTPGKQIIVKLSAQMTFACENGQLVRAFVVSTGIKGFETRIGEYHIWIKLASTTMDGPGYHYEHVRWTQYFDQGRGFHEKWWNHIYGRPTSHGCVNMTAEDSKWLYDWTNPVAKGTVTYPSDKDPGTDVLVIP